MPRVQIIKADLTDAAQQREIVRLIDLYARDEMGGGRPLAEDVKSRLGPGLLAHPTTIILLAYDDRNEAIGVCVCFLGFSTFRAMPLLNVHDLAVAPAARGKGVGRALLESAEREARRLGCCKLTLEVLARNRRAMALYHSCGFIGVNPAQFDRLTLFCTKDLSSG